MAACLAACSPGDGTTEVAGVTTPATSPVTTSADVLTTADGAGPTTRPPITAAGADESQRCTAPAPGAPHVITVWHAFTPDTQRTFDALLDRYRSANPGTTVTSVKLANYRQVIDQLRVTPAAQRPDVLVGDSLSLGLLVDADLSIDPLECTQGRAPATLQDLVPVVEATYTVDDRLVAAPYNVSAPVLVFDAVKFRTAGLDPADPPDTLDELLLASRQIVSSGAATYGMAAHDAYSLMEQWAAQRGELVTEPANGRAGERATAYAIDTPANTEALAWLRAIVADRLAVWVGANPSGIDDLLALVNPATPAAMTAHTSASLGQVLQLVESGGVGRVELGVGPLPGPGRGSHATGGALWLLDHGDAERAGAAWALIDWLLRDDQIAVLDASTGYVPPRRSTTSHPVLSAAWIRHPQLRVAFDQLEATPVSAAAIGPLVGPRIDVAERLSTTIGDLVANGGDPAERLRLARQEAEAILRSYGELVPPRR